MTVKLEANGRRSVQVEFEVPGTPEEVWQAIASGPGIAALGAFNCGGPSMVALNFYLYGDRSAETAAHETPLWQAWFQERFPMPTEPGKSE